MDQSPRLIETKTASSEAPNFFIRVADITDLQDFFELALVAGAGFTSLPANEALLAERLERSRACFAGEGGSLILALEDLDAGRVVGCAAIKASGAPRSDFLNFLVDENRQSLAPTSLYADLTEVGSLLIHPDYRRFGIGRWLAQSRYLVIAGQLPRFGAHIFSELRGVIDADSQSPFYDEVVAPFFDLTYEEADYLSAHGAQAELNALLPSSPIAIHGLSDEAAASIGAPHRDGQKALWFLEDEGFSFEGAVDLLDGGPLVVAPSRSIRTIAASFEATVMPGFVDDDERSPVILAAGEGADFRTVKDEGVIRGHSIICRPETLERTGIAEGARARVCPDQKKPVLQPSVAKETVVCRTAIEVR